MGQQQQPTHLTLNSQQATTANFEYLGGSPRSPPSYYANVNNIGGVNKAQGCCRATCMAKVKAEVCAFSTD